MYPSLVLVQPRKTRPYITERLLMGCKESNQTKSNNYNLGAGLFHSMAQFSLFKVPTSSGNHGKPGKSLKKVPCIEKSWNLKSLNNHGKILDFFLLI